MADLKTDNEGKLKLLSWQRAALEVADSIGYRMIDDRPVPEITLKDLAYQLRSIAERVEREVNR